MFKLLDVVNVTTQYVLYKKWEESINQLWLLLMNCNSCCLNIQDIIIQIVVNKVLKVYSNSLSILEFDSHEQF